MSAFDREIFHDETSARDWLESILWPHGTVCPHCGLIGAAYKLNGKAQRPGLYKCKGCEEQFTVTIGTIFERSHIKLHVWLQAFFLMMASKKGMSAHQMHRMLGVTYKTAWFMCHRIREALREDGPLSPLGGQNKVVEVDETYVGGKAANRKNYVPAKTAVVALITVESYFSILKRGIIGTYHHVSQEHLDRYLAEFDFRHNNRTALGVNDAERTVTALKGAAGKRLTYRRTRRGRGQAEA